MLFLGSWLSVTQQRRFYNLSNYLDNKISVYNRQIKILKSYFLCLQINSLKLNCFSPVSDTWWADSIQQCQCCITSILLVSRHQWTGSELPIIISSHHPPSVCISPSDNMDPGDLAPHDIIIDWDFVSLYPVSNGSYHDYAYVNIDPSRDIFPRHPLIMNFPRNQVHSLYLEWQILRMLVIGKLGSWD